MSTNGQETTRVPILELEGIHTYYGAIHALKGVTLEVHDGEIVTLLGANGAGKSTTLRSINGLNHPRRGKIRFRGEDITYDAPHDIVYPFIGWHKVATVYGPLFTLATYPLAFAGVTVSFWTIKIVTAAANPWTSPPCTW